MDTTKIIKGVVGGGRYTVTAPIVKEDYGLYLKIEGLELPATYEVDFSNDEHNGTSVTMIGNADGVLIPHQFIDSGKDVFAFLYHVGADFGRTVYKFRIPNKLRPDRTNEQPTPEEQSTIDQAISALNTAVEQTAQDVIDAAASAQSASQSAENAHDSAVDAQNYAESAQTYANNASASASQASASATASAQSASDAETARQTTTSLVAEAQGYANASAQSAQASAQSASQAHQFAQTASLEAESAQDYATQADISANTASNKAQEASTSAQTASTKATESANSASQALTYKNDAESAKTASQTAQGKAEDAQTAAETAQGLAEDAQEAAESAAASVSASAAQIATNTADIADLQTDVAQNEADILKAFPTDSASGAIASFSDGADNIPLKSLVVNIDPVQDLHGYDSPWVGGGGKNKIPFPYASSSGTVDGITYTIDEDGKITATGTTERGTNFFFVRNTTLTAGTYTASVIGDFAGLTLMIYDSVNKVTVCNILPAESVHYKTFTIESDKIVNIYLNTGQTGATVNISAYFQLEQGSIATSYAPYENICPISGWTEVQTNQSDADMTNPTTLTIQLGQTVYGGKLDVLSGVLRVYPYYASYNGETLTGKWISDRDVYVAGTTPTIGAQVVNIGAEGTEYQLTPYEVKSLLGVNNIWADTGDTACEYRADTKLYIEKLTQPEEDDMIADSAITSGQFFMIGNSLYRALTNIASGATITVGTNAQRVSLSDALNLVNA